MKLPNGYGTVYRLSGNRRNPFVARKTTGWKVDESGRKRQIMSTIGYFPDRNSALQALAEYNGDPYDLSLNSATFAQIFELWKKDEFNDESNPNTVRGYNAAFKHCDMLYGVKMSSITTPQLQKVLDDHCDMSYERVNKIRNLFNKMYKWCIKNEYLKRNKAQGLSIKISPNTDEKNPFTNDEIQIVWEYQRQYPTDKYIKIILILIYCGVRINELLYLKKNDVDIKEQIFIVRKSKTDAGKNRSVPIADKVLPFWLDFINCSTNEYVVLNDRGNRLTYDDFRKHHWNRIMEKLSLNHTIHETRHTCISQLMKKKVDKTIVKKIVGHKSVMDLTERVYTHYENQELVEAINLIP